MLFNKTSHWSSSDINPMKRPRRPIHDTSLNIYLLIPSPWNGAQHTDKVRISEDSEKDHRKGTCCEKPLREHALCQSYFLDPKLCYATWERGISPQ